MSVFAFQLVCLGVTLVSLAVCVGSFVSIRRARRSRTSWLTERRQDRDRPLAAWRWDPGSETFLPTGDRPVSDRSRASVEHGQRVLLPGKSGVSVCVWSEESGWMCSPPLPTRTPDQRVQP
jgi:hypothetical protein